MDESVVRHFEIETTKHSELLKRARALIDAPEKWTQDASRRDFGGKLAFCMSGALQSSFGFGIVNDPTYSKLYQRLHDAAGKPCSIEGWNDARYRTHAEVMACFDRAIATAEAEGN